MREPTRAELDRLRQLVAEVYPDLALALCARGPDDARRAPPERTLAFRLVDGRGRSRSAVVWLAPAEILALSPDALRARVAAGTGR
ncbi:MAG: hypothetical protein IT373_38130 [Polyangiaceae bacterium]|nr:hypothetical protein [Polyangiaceae bacterium]